MRTKILKTILITLATGHISFITMSQSNNPTTPATTLPKAAKMDHPMSAHGDTRNDAYYWMRLSDEQKQSAQPDKQTKQVRDYLEAENTYTETVLQHTDSLQKTLYDEIVGRIKQDDASVPYFDNGYWYYVRYEEGKEYPIYCRKPGTMEADEEVMLNVNEMAENYDYYEVSGLEVSPDNQWLSYGVDTLSRRMYDLYTKNLKTGETLPAVIPNTASGHAAWADDSRTFFYTEKDDVTLLTKRIKRHTLDTDPAEDAMVYEEESPSFYIGVYREKSGEFITIVNSSTMVDDYWILPSNQPQGKFQHFSPREEDHKYQIAHHEGKFYILTNWDAQNFRLMETSDTLTDKEHWQEVIPHRAEVLLENMEVFKDYLALEERQEGNTEFRIRNLRSSDEHYVEFQEPAYTVYIHQNPGYDTPLFRYGYTSLTTPNSVYDYNMQTQEKTLLKQQEVVGGHNPEEYVSERLMAPSRDGVKIPISLVYKKGLKENEPSPLLLYAYGSYGNTIDPYFSTARLSLLDRGFVFAIAHIRGGQMLGRAWYEDGKMFKKKNTFNDYIDCAEYLIQQQYTEPEKLFAMGGSAGGLLMGAVVNMRPELFRGVVAGVPFVDVITTMSDPTIPLTTNEYDEWGNPENEDSYRYMLSYSPYDNVKAQPYPNMLVTTGFFDSQVQYWEPAKWVAKLREYKTDNNQLLLYTNMEFGHGGASGRFEQYKETALEYAFMLDLVGIKE